MSTAAKHRFEVITGPTGAPWAVFGAKTEENEPGVAWSGRFDALDAFCTVGKLLPAESAIFCAELTKRWGRLVLCTGAFLADARLKEGNDAYSGAPSGFFLEVLS